MRRERAHWSGAKHTLDELELFLPRVTPVHPLQHPRGAGLHRQMNVLAHRLGVSHRSYHAVAEIIGVRTGEAKSPQPIHLSHRTQQVGEVVPAVVVRIHRLTEEYDFRHSLSHNGLRLAHDVLESATPLRAARRRHNAVGAPVIAPTLYWNPCLHAIEATGRKIFVVLFQIEIRAAR